jgi:hypothetical protein
VRSDDPSLSITPAPCDIAFAQPTWPAGDDAAFTRLLLSLGALAHAPAGEIGQIGPPPPAPPGAPAETMAPVLPPATPVLDLPFGMAPPPPAAPPPPRAEELPAPLVGTWTPPPPADQPATIRPVQPPQPLLLLEQRWDVEAGLLLWVGNGTALGAVRGPALPPPLPTRRPRSRHPRRTCF